MAIYFLFGSRKESFIELCSRTQNPTVILTVRDSCLFHTPKVFQRAASWSAFVSELWVFHCISGELESPLSSQEAESHLSPCAKRTKTFLLSSSISLFRRIALILEKVWLQAMQEGKVSPHTLNDVVLRPVMQIPMMLPLNLCIGVCDLLYFCLVKSLFFG